MAGNEPSCRRKQHRSIRQTKEDVIPLVFGFPGGCLVNGAWQKCWLWNCLAESGQVDLAFLEPSLWFVKAEAQCLVQGLCCSYSDSPCQPWGILWGLGNLATHLHSMNYSWPCYGLNLECLLWAYMLSYWSLVSSVWRDSRKLEAGATWEK